MNAKRRPPPVLAGQQRGSISLARGVWRLRYRDPADPAGKRKQRTVVVGSLAEFKSFDDVRAEADRVMAKLAPRRLLPGASLPWPEWCDRYRRRYLVLLRKPSQRTIGNIIGKHIEPSFQHLRSHEISAAVIQEWVSAQARAGITRNTILSRWGVLRMLLYRAQAEGVSASVPGRRVIKFPKRSDVRERLQGKAFTPDEMAAMIEAAKPQWFRTLLAVLRYTGMRAGEALALKWSDIDFGAGLMHVRRSASQGEIGPTKTERSRRDVPIAPPLAEFLREWQQAAPANETWLVFCGEKGRPRTSNGVRERHLRPLLKQLELPERSLHAFRHGCCFAMLNGGANPASVRDVLGHASLQQTNEYAGSAHEDRRAAIEAGSGPVLSR